MHRQGDGLHGSTDHTLAELIITKLLVLFLLIIAPVYYGGTRIYGWGRRLKNLLYKECMMMCEKRPLYLSEYHPVSELVVESHDLRQPKFPAIDVHAAVEDSRSMASIKR